MRQCLLLAGTFLLIVNVGGALLVVVDKRRARKGAIRRAARRVPESTLLTFAILGAWPALIAAHRLARHKTAKLSYLSRFALTVPSSIVLWMALLHFSDCI